MEETDGLVGADEHIQSKPKVDLGNHTDRASLSIYDELNWIGVSRKRKCMW